MTPCQAASCLAVCAIGVALSPLAVAWDALAWLLDRVAKAAALATLLVALAGCAHHRPKPPTPPDWTPPLFVATAEYDGISPAHCPDDKASSATANTTAQAWLGYHKRTDGRRPPSMPGPGEVVRIKVKYQKNCDTTAEKSYPGENRYSCIVKAWSCTHDEPWTKDAMLSALCHWLSHAVSGLGGGNAAHVKFAEVCGC